MTTKNRNGDHDDDGGITAVTAELVTEATPIMNSNNNPNHGTWNSGLCACCKYGCCHPALWCACCFPMLFMGQVRVVCVCVCVFFKHLVRLYSFSGEGEDDILYHVSIFS